jgi:hypothetical protein
VPSNQKQILPQGNQKRKKGKNKNEKVKKTENEK